MKRPLFASVMALAVLVLSDRAGASDPAQWPRFRGPNGTARAPEAKLPVEWTPSNILWKAALPGLGASSPCVWDDRLFVTAADPAGKERWMLCYHSRSGELLWKQLTTLETHKKHKKNSYATATPTTDGTHAYFLFTAPHAIKVLCFDFAGKKVWEQDLGPFASGHGSGSSPILCGNKLIVPNDEEANSFVVALAKESGRVIWKTPRPSEQTSFSTPFLLTAGGRTQIILSSMQGLTSLDAETGSQNWICDRFEKRTVGSPFQAAGLVLATCGSGSRGDRLTAVRPDGSGDVTATHVPWEETKTVPYCPTPLAVGDWIFLLTDVGGIVRCLDARTGHEVWHQRLQSNFSASPVGAGREIFCVGEDGDVFVLAAEPSYRLLAHNRIPDHFITTPAIAGNRLYLRGEQQLWCIGAP